jgi:hypothetical protein
VEGSRAMSWAPVVQAVSIAVTAVFAVISLRAWRAQLVGKRRFEVAEHVITAVYEVQEAVSYLRRSYYMSDDARDRPRPDEEESELEAQKRDICFIIEKRFNEMADKFVALQKARLLCKVHFGSEAVDNIKEFFDARNLIYTMLLQARGPLSHRRLIPLEEFLILSTD